MQICRILCHAFLANLPLKNIFLSFLFFKFFSQLFPGGICFHLSMEWTPRSIVLKPRSDRKDYIIVVCFMAHDCSGKLRKKVPMQAKLRVVLSFSWKAPCDVIS